MINYLILINKYKVEQIYDNLLVLFKKLLQAVRHEQIIFIVVGRFIFMYFYNMFYIYVNSWVWLMIE